MRKKQMFGKCFAVLTVLTMLAVTVVSAETPQYTTTTKYHVDNDYSMVEVISTIYYVEPGEQITYLAYDIGPEGIAEPYAEAGATNIVFIDQKQANGTEVEFKYIAPTTEIGTTLVKFGAERSKGITPKVAGTDDYIKTYAVSAAPETDIENPGYVLHGSDCTFIITPPADKKIKGITRNDLVEVDMNNVIIGATGEIFYTVNNITEDFILTVTYEEDNNDVTEAQVSKPVSFSANTLDDSGNANVTVFSNVTVPKTANNIEYGILFSYKQGATFADIVLGDGNLSDNVVGVISKGNGTKKFRALGKGLNGNFAVQLIDDEVGTMLSGVDYYITPYVVIDGVYNDVRLGEETAFLAE
jgi:hypothetical protein